MNDADPRCAFDAALIPGMRKRLASYYHRFRARELEVMRANSPLESSGGGSRFLLRDCPSCGHPSATLPPFLTAHGLDLVSCPDCALTYSRQVMEEVADQARYAHSSLDAEAMRLRLGGPYLELESARARYYLSRLMEVMTPGRLLEIGSGTGTLLVEASRLGWQSIGLEPGHAAAHEARLRGANIVEGWFPADLPGEDGPFDAIAILDVLEHMAEPLHFLGEIAKQLTVGGRLLVQVPNWDSLLVQLEGERSSVVCPGHWTYFTMMTLPDLIARAGFRTLHIETVISELDRIMAYPHERISACLNRLRPGSPTGLSASTLHELGLGYKVFAICEMA